MDVTAQRALLLLVSTVLVVGLAGCSALPGLDGGEEEIRLGMVAIQNDHNTSHDVSVELRTSDETIINKTYHIEADNESSPLQVPTVVIEEIPDEPATYTLLAETSNESSQVTIPNDLTPGDCTWIEIEFLDSGDFGMWMSSGCASLGTSTATTADSNVDGNSHL